MIKLKLAGRPNQYLLVQTSYSHRMASWSEKFTKRWFGKITKWKVQPWLLDFGWQNPLSGPTRTCLMTSPIDPIWLVSPFADLSRLLNLSNVTCIAQAPRVKMMECDWNILTIAGFARSYNLLILREFTTSNIYCHTRLEFPDIYYYSIIMGVNWKQHKAHPQLSVLSVGCVFNQEIKWNDETRTIPEREHMTCMQRHASPSSLQFTGIHWEINGNTLKELIGLVMPGP